MSWATIAAAMRHLHIQPLVLVALFAGGCNPITRHYVDAGQDSRVDGPEVDIPRQDGPADGPGIEGGAEDGPKGEDIESPQLLVHAGSAGVPGDDDGPLKTARFDGPTGLAVDESGTVYVADFHKHRIRKIAGGQVSTFAGGNGSGTKDGPKGQAQFAAPLKVAATATQLFVTDNKGMKVRSVNLSTQEVSTVLAADPYEVKEGAGVAFSASNRGNGTLMYVALMDKHIYRHDILATSPGAPWVTGLTDPHAIVAGANGDAYITDNNRIVHIVTSGATTPIAGDGHYRSVNHADGLKASFANPQGLALLPSGDILVAETDAHCIRRIEAGGSRSVTTSWGKCGEKGLLDAPSDIAYDAKSDRLYVADKNLHIILMAENLAHL